MSPKSPGKHPTSLEEVVSGGLCTGCGICASMAKPGEIEMVVTERGYTRPSIAADSRAGTVPELLSVCPGANLQGPEHRDGIDHHPVWGPVAELHRTWSGEPAVRHAAAAGGTLTALARYLLDSREVEAVLHVRVNRDDPMLTDALVSRTADDALSGAKSRYGPGAPLVHVMRLLDEGIHFAVIGKPCDIAAIRNLAKIDSRVDAQVAYCLTIFCGGVFSMQTSEKIVAHYGVERSEVVEFQWRGDGWPGPTRVVSRDGDIFEKTYEEMWFQPWPWTEPYDLQWRCKICPDAIGELADVAVPDGWILKDGIAVHEEGDGVNVAIARTRAGQRLLVSAMQAGYLERGPMTFEELDVMHADHLPRKLGHPARRLAMAAAGQPVPHVGGYRSWTTVRHAGLRHTFSTFIGTLKRVRAGRNREPLG
jgi:coenzyme F420 hydrogenase subunit beta